MLFYDLFRLFPFHSLINNFSMSKINSLSKIGLAGLLLTSLMVNVQANNLKPAAKADTTGKISNGKVPEENRFTKTVLSDDLNEPMELSVAPDGRVFFVERTGKFYVYDPKLKKTRLSREFPVFGENKYGNGLLGMTIDPNFKTNHYLYFFYTPQLKDHLKQYVSRFVVNDDSSLDEASEKVIIEIPIDMEVSAHTGGSLAWDAHGNLYISTGDNTVPFESDGFAPIDERVGRLVFDAQRSAGNPNDLRGKILKIHPQADGSYTIPEGNLFPKGLAGTRPEIYTMGCRNPYRISVDPATSIVYWGEIGPDSGTDGKQGPKGYDEFNQAKKPGNYGWPYFVGNNKPYKDYDFSNKAIGEYFQADAPVNNSPNNTGMQNLPPAQKAMIWYPYDLSPEFPSIGTGGRSAMAGPVYHFDPSLNSSVKIPAYYDKALFIFDWMRNWVFAVRLDENQNFTGLERFMPEAGDFRRPIDMEFGPEGSIYMLEYGSVYGIDNDDARLVRIDFNPGNRAPVANVTAKDTIGLAPLKVSFNSSKSYDFDGDQLSYEWRFEGNKVASHEANPEYTFKKNGIYKSILKVTDPAGKSAYDTLIIRVGNTLPQVSIKTNSNSTFYFDNTPLNYSVKVADNEDKVIDPKKIKVTLNYLAKITGNKATLGHQQISGSLNLGKSLMAASDCKACHQIEKKSVGPAFMEVSKRYRGDKSAISKLANKVIVGGGGVWGEHAMAAHPQISKEDATEIVKYVLSLGNQQPEVRLPKQGSRILKDHLGKGDQGRYILTASYTDNGGAIKPLTNSDVLVLRSTKVEAEDADELSNIKDQEKALGEIHDKSFFVLKNIDLQGVKELTYHYSSQNRDAAIEVHTDSPDGALISTLNYQATGKWDKYADASTAIRNPGGKHDLYFVFVKKEGPNKHLCSLDWILFK